MASKLIERAVDALGAGHGVQGPQGQVIAAPSALQTNRPPPVRRWVPAPNIQRIGLGAETPAKDEEGTQYKRSYVAAGDSRPGSSALSHKDNASPKRTTSSVSFADLGVSVSRLSQHSALSDVDGPVLRRYHVHTLNPQA